MRRLNADQLVEILSRGMDLPGRLGAVELRCVAADGRHLGVEGIGDVHDERRLHRILAVREGVEDFERPVRGAPPPPPPPPPPLPPPVPRRPATHPCLRPTPLLPSFDAPHKV